MVECVSLYSMKIQGVRSIVVILPSRLSTDARHKEYLYTIYIIYMREKRELEEKSPRYGIPSFHSWTYSKTSSTLVHCWPDFPGHIRPIPSCLNPCKSRESDAVQVSPFILEWLQLLNFSKEWNWVPARWEDDYCKPKDTTGDRRTTRALEQVLPKCFPVYRRFYAFFRENHRPISIELDHLLLITGNYLAIEFIEPFAR